jgi:hypothetical protein
MGVAPDITLISRAEAEHAWPVTADARARSIFEALHDRHVPVTPALSMALARMETTTDPAAIRPWGRAYGHAGAALGLGGRFGRTAHWARLGDVFISAVAEPLLRRAARAAGVVHIVTPGGGPRRDSAGYGAACARIEAAIDAMLDAPETAGAGFWSHAGAKLHAAYRHRVSAALTRGDQELPPSPDPLVCRLVFDVEPELPQSTAAPKRPLRSKARSERSRSMIRPREGGVEGIVHTRRPDDLGEALLTSYAYPPELLLSRLLEEGFLIPHRPPLRRPRRHLLALAFNTSPLGAGPGAVAKAAWIDASLRLGVLLGAQNLRETEFGWCDLMETGLLPAAVSVSTIATKETARLDPFMLGGDLRRSMAARSTLLPSALAGLPARPWREGRLEDRPRDAMRALLGECARARLAGAAIGRGAEARAAAMPRHADAAEYATTVALRITLGHADGARRVTEWRDDRATFLHAHGLIGARSGGAPDSLRLRAGQMLLPEQVAPGHAFRVASDGDPVERAIAPDPDLAPAPALAALIGALSEWFMGQITQALDEG